MKNTKTTKVTIDSSIKADYYDLWGLLSLTHRAINKARERELMKCGVTVEQASILHIIFVLDHKPTATELSRYLIREPHSVCQTANKMVTLGLLKKIRDSKRRNIYRFSLSDKGLASFRCSRNRESIESIISELSKKDSQELISYLHTLLDAATERIGIDRLPLPSAQLEGEL